MRITPSIVCRALALLAAVLLNACASMPGAEADAEADRQFRALADQLNADSPLQDYVQLRALYAHTSFYSPLGSMLEERALFEAKQAGNWTECSERAGAILASDFTSLSAHFAAMVCAYERQRPEQGDFHRRVIGNFMDAIWSTGDGRAPATAFVINSTNELRAFIELQGYAIESQELVHEDTHSYDLMEITDPENGERQQWYFNIDAQWRNYGKLLD